jgi:hypothetical protein
MLHFSLSMVEACLLQQIFSDLCLHTETHVCFHVKCLLLLPDVIQNLNVNRCSQNPQNKIVLKSVWCFSSCNMDRETW